MRFAFENALPTWMRFIDGEAPLVFVAPHGGRRLASAPIRDSIKVNDLHTAELTAELAARTQGYALINQALDRNDLDLNRISQVRAHATWFLEALVELLFSLAERHDEVRIFFIHGWNVVQPVCDLGMGLKERGEQIVPASKYAAPTLSPEFFSSVVLPFQAAALTAGLDVAIGRRYPAADKENVMQLFSARFAKDQSVAIRSLADLSMQRRVEAVQLELGVGLRWPGAERERFVEIFCQTLANGVSPARRKQEVAFPSLPTPALKATTQSQLNGSSALLSRTSELARFGLHFHDPLSGLGVMGGVECGGEAHTHSGRLMLSLGGTEMALFTGEDAARREPGRIQIGGLLWRGEPDGFSITYRGPMMRFSHPQAFIRLEEGLAASWVESADIRLRLTIPFQLDSALLPLFLAHLRGEVWLCDGERRIDAWGFLDTLKPEETGRLSPRRLVSLPFGPDLGVFLSWVETSEGPRSSGILYHYGVPQQLRPEEWELLYTLEDGRPTAFQVSVSSASSFSLQCRGETVTAIPIVRHASQGSALNVTFGLSRLVWEGREARGVYEFSERRRNVS